MATSFICATCGTGFASREAPPATCPICEDERQYVPASGQAWTTPEKLAATHFNTFRKEGELLGVGIEPKFGINQRALIVRTPTGNVLWDCVSLVSDAAVELIDGIGGLAAIAISHPHYYARMTEWSRRFGGIPIHLHAADRAWVADPDPAIDFWTGETKEILPGLTLVRCGGHYDGGAVLHWRDGAGGKGALLTGDVLQVTTDRAHLAFLRSYPNYLPLGRAAVETIAARVRPWPFAHVYGAFWNFVIRADGHDVLERSVARHIDWLQRDAA